ncbi:hypothetical protein GCM10023205_17080 [Yinghuangia aomiensis]|uniref:Uncharacterized protein n=1 Tax=Yinghuangia aomiensis TaxID=676205 RepID=A0ABP9GZ75_9ACTN
MAYADFATIGLGIRPDPEVRATSVNEVPRPRSESARPAAGALPASSPFDCWVGIPRPLRKHRELVGAERAFALADWVEDVGAMNLASELLRTREVLADVLRLLRQCGVDPVAEFERAAAAERAAVGAPENPGTGAPGGDMLAACQEPTSTTVPRPGPTPPGPRIPQPLPGPQSLPGPPS